VFACTLPDVLEAVPAGVEVELEEVVLEDPQPVTGTAAARVISRMAARRKVRVLSRASRLT
jgi:hypothetical protein